MCKWQFENLLQIRLFKPIAYHFTAGLLLDNFTLEYRWDVGVNWCGSFWTLGDTWNLKTEASEKFENGNKETQNIHYIKQYKNVLVGQKSTVSVSFLSENNTEVECIYLNRLSSQTTKTVLEHHQFCWKQDNLVILRPAELRWK